MSQKVVKITCACRAKRCAVCSKCSRCECGHDGLSVETKMARGRGGKQPSASAKRSSTTKTLDYVEASHSEDDSPPLCSTPLIPTRKKPRNGRTVPSSSSSRDVCAQLRSIYCKRRETRRSRPPQWQHKKLYQRNPYNERYC